MHRFFTLALLIICNMAFGQTNMPPQVLHLQATTSSDGQSLTINYDLLDVENDTCEIWVELSGTDGANYLLTNSAVFSGSLGMGILPGNGKMIQADISNAAFQANQNFTVRVTALDHQPLSIQELVDQVDSNRLRANMQFIEGIRHRSTGPNHLIEVRDSISNLFQRQGIHSAVHSFSFSPNYMGQNLIGTHPGYASGNDVYIVDAHYDTVNNAPGADDNGSGVVGFMEICRLLSPFPAEKTVKFIGFDLEEEGLRGSIAYLQNGELPNEEVKGVFNFEMIGYYSEEPNSQALPVGFNQLFPEVYAAVEADQFRGNFITNISKAGIDAPAQAFSQAAANYVPGLKVVSVNEPVGFFLADFRRSDHAPFWTQNIPAVMLTDGANFRNECYHTPNDTAENKLNFTFMSNVTKATLAALAESAGIRHGGWATTNFTGVSETRQISDCRQSVNITTGGLEITYTDCMSEWTDLSLYDVAGRVVCQWSDIPLDNGSAWLPMNKVPTGVYYLRGRHAKGVYSQAVFVR